MSAAGWGRGTGAEGGSGGGAVRRSGAVGAAATVVSERAGRVGGDWNLYSSTRHQARLPQL